jgi:hypothetical protein
MKHKTKRITFFAVIVLEFSIFWGISNLFALQNPWSILVLAVMVSVGVFTILLYLWDLQDIEKEIRSLKQKYTWQ